MKGQEIGHYRILDKLGEGGMGVVYRAEDTMLHRDVALKFPSAENRDRLLAEARAAAALNHPNICTVYEVNESLGFLAMELVEGTSLAAKLGGRPLPLSEAVEIASQVADGLVAAHARRITHRDIKPANILVTSNGQVKITDFGLARSVDATRRTQTGDLAGTLAYMSPEQLSGNRVDHRTDLYSLGLVLHEMLTGHLPPPGHFEPLPAPFDRIVAKALAPDPNNRYQQAADLSVDLRNSRSPSAATISQARASRKPWVWGGGLALLAVIAGIAIWTRTPGQIPGRSAWVQLTDLPDAVSQPALSPDGRMLTFIRGAGTFMTPGQIYIKMLPAGEAKPLTNDAFRKMSPVFSPDGSQVVYSVRDEHAQWSSWAVQVLGGEPRPFLANASGLVWIEPGRVLFSEKKPSGAHMKIVTSDESRAGARDVFVPVHEMGMAHRSYPSPDKNWAIVVEMDHEGAWLPCRLVPMKGGSQGQRIGPQNGGCRSAAWTNDGKWMYMDSDAGGISHIWRQRFPNGKPEQITSGPTEEEGIAMAADGTSFITAVGMRQSSVWIHDGNGERQISLEGRAHEPKFSPDGTKVFYRVENSNGLWMADVATGRSQRLLTGFEFFGKFGTYDISPDSRKLVIAAQDLGGNPRIWIALVDGRYPPRQIPHVVGEQPAFYANDGVVFRGREGDAWFAFAVREDGTALRKLANHPLYQMQGVSADRQWLMGRFIVESEEGKAQVPTFAVPIDGGAPMRFSVFSLNQPLAWSGDGKRLYIRPPRGSMGTAQTVVVPLPARRMLPDIPAGGFRSMSDVMKLPGVHLVAGAEMAPGPSEGVYAFSRESVQRNLYRIPILH